MLAVEPGWQVLVYFVSLRVLSSQVSASYKVSIFRLLISSILHNPSPQFAAIHLLFWFHFVQEQVNSGYLCSAISPYETIFKIVFSSI